MNRIHRPRITTTSILILFATACLLFGGLIASPAVAQSDATLISASTGSLGLHKDYSIIATVVETRRDAPEAEVELIVYDIHNRVIARRAGTLSPEKPVLLQFHHRNLRTKDARVPVRVEARTAVRGSAGSGLRILNQPVLSVEFNRGGINDFEVVSCPIASVDPGRGGPVSANCGPCWVNSEPIF